MSITLGKRRRLWVLSAIVIRPRYARLLASSNQLSRKDHVRVVAGTIVFANWCLLDPFIRPVGGSGCFVGAARREIAANAQRADFDLAIIAPRLVYAAGFVSTYKGWVLAGRPRAARHMHTASGAILIVEHDLVLAFLLHRLEANRKVLATARPPA